MKLISAHIRNFGKLSDKDYNFKDGINSFVEDNGAGKSTLAAFIKAMLFGMESLRTNETDFKDRKHYAPFNGQSYGGTLVFEHDKKEYRIERTFDVKSSVKDSLVIYVDKVETSFDEEIGEYILGLDKESFERLLFIEPKDIKMSAEGSIKKNLNNIIDNTVEGVDFDALIDKLDEIIKKYNAKKTTSFAHDLKDKKKALEETIANQVVVSNSLTGKYEIRNQLNEQLEVLVKKQAALSEQNATLECWNTYNNMVKVVNDKKDNLSKIESKYPKGYPTDEEIKQLRKLFETRTTLAGTLKGITFDESKLATLNVLKDKYSKGIPTDEEMNAYEKLIPEYNRVVTLSSAESVQLTDEEKSILNKFNGKDVESDLTKVEALINEYKAIDNSLKTTPKFEETQAPSNKGSSKFPLILLIASILLIGGGIAMFFVQFIVGIVLMVLGVLGLIASGFLYLKNRIDTSNKGVVVTNSNVIQLESQLKTKEDEIHQVITPYGIYTQSVYSDFERFKSEYDRYKEIVNKQKESEKSGSERKKVIEDLEKEIREFLSKYVTFDNFTSGFQKLKDELRELDTLSKSYDAYVKAKDESDTNLKATTLSIKLISDKYELGLLEGKHTLDEIATDILNINRLKQEIAKDEESAKQYKEEKELGDEPPQLDEEDYSEQIKQFTSDISKIDQQIDSDERDIESLEDNRQALLDIQNSINECEHKFDILTKLGIELQKAQKTLDDKYVAPIMERFAYYSNLLGDLLGVKIEMGRNFNVLLNIDGTLKSDEHLSSGQRSICALCFRLALLDNIYNGDIPFVIMDDPFMTLDEKNLKATVAMLQKLSKGKQIIYFACHPSRKI